LPPWPPKGPDQRLPPMLRRSYRRSMTGCSKGARGLFVLSRVIGILTDTAISPSLRKRQLPSRYSIRAGRNLPDKEFRYLRTVIVTAAVYRGFGSPLRPEGLTGPLNLPAPGRSQSVYVGLDNALARSCVFAKQSLGTIHCGRLELLLYGVTYHRHPLSRSYGVILPSSFSVNHSSPLGYSPRPPVSDYGTVNCSPGLRSFSWQCASATLGEA
jgi:hypothetical protein